MKDVFDEVTRWRERGDKIALAMVVDVQRSAPRAPGTKMAVSDRGEIAGGVSGGCVEGAVVEILDDAALAIALRSPAGFVGAIAREETALSMFAEVVAARHGREGGRLASGSGRIHQVPA